MPALRTFREAYGRPGRHEFPLFRRGLKSTLGQVYIGTGIRGEWSGVPFPHGGRRWSRISLCLPIPDIRSRYNSLKGETLRGTICLIGPVVCVGLGRAGRRGCVGAYGGGWCDRAVWRCLGHAGSIPAGSIPAGSIPAGSIPAGPVPAGSVPAGSVPAGSVLGASIIGGSVHAGPVACCSAFRPR